MIFFSVGRGGFSRPFNVVVDVDVDVDEGLIGRLKPPLPSNFRDGLYPFSAEQQRVFSTSQAERMKTQPIGQVSSSAPPASG